VRKNTAKFAETKKVPNNVTVCKADRPSLGTYKLIALIGAAMKDTSTKQKMEAGVKT